MGIATRRLHGSLNDKGTLRVLASLNENEVEYDFISVDMESGEHLSDTFLSLSPFGDVPVLQDGELTIFGSRAIMRYVAHGCHRPGKEQIYIEPKLQGIAAIWIDVEDHQCDPPASKLIHELVEKPKQGTATDETVVAEEETKLANVLDIYEHRLTESKYLGGNKFTAADLTNLPNFYYLKGTHVKQLWESRPHVNAWCVEIMARPGWTNHIFSRMKSLERNNLKHQFNSM